MRDITPASGIVMNEYLYSTVGATFDSATLDKDTVDTVDSDNNKYLNRGVVLSVINTGAASGLVGPYDTGASDGRELSTGIVGVNDTFADLTNGDVEVGVLTHGVVNESGVTVNGVEGTVTSTQKGYLRSGICDITFGRE